MKDSYAKEGSNEVSRIIEEKLVNWNNPTVSIFGVPKLNVHQSVVKLGRNRPNFSFRVENMLLTIKVSQGTNW